MGIDIEILIMEFEDFKLEITEGKKVERKKVNKENMTEEERDIAMGYYPFFPELKYGSKKIVMNIL